MGRPKKGAKKNEAKAPKKLPTRIVKRKGAETYSNMSEFIALVASKLEEQNVEVTKEVDDGYEVSKKGVKTVIEVISDVIVDQLCADDEHKAKTPFGVTLLVVDVPAKPARDGRNPATGETIRLPKRPASVKLKARIQK